MEWRHFHLFCSEFGHHYGVCFKLHQFWVHDSIFRKRNFGSACRRFSMDHVQKCDTHDGHRYPNDHLLLSSCQFWIWRVLVRSAAFYPDAHPLRPHSSFRSVFPSSNNAKNVLSESSEKEFDFFEMLWR